MDDFEKKSEATPINRLKATQANKLVYSSHSMTLNEKRLLMLAICKISTEMSTFPILYVRIQDLIEYLEVDGNSFHSNLKATCRSLLRRLVEIESDDGDVWEAFQWVSKAKLNKKTGLLKLQLHQDLEPYLLGLKESFQTLNYSDMAGISSVLALRIYEILHHKRMESGIPQSEFEISIDDLRKWLDLKGKYKQHSHFRTKILEIAKREMREKTPLIMHYECIKKMSNKYDYVRFTVYPNDKFSPDKLPPASLQMMLDLKTAETYKDQKKLVLDYFNKHLNNDAWSQQYKKFMAENRTPEDMDIDMNWAIGEIIRKKDTQNPVMNPVGYVANAITKKLGHNKIKTLK